MIQINKRQEKVLELIKNGIQQISGIYIEIEKTFPNASRITVIRDLNKLIEIKLVIRTGGGRNTSYQVSPYAQLVEPINIEQYFQIEPDKRPINNRFNWGIFELLTEILTPDETIKLDNINKLSIIKSKHASPEVAKQELERLIIEFSWKSSVIEGNTYTLLDTERLIKEGRLAKGKKKEEATMILNHKKAFDFVVKNTKDLRSINISKIEHIHYLLTKKMGVTRNLRKSPVGIVGTKYRPLDNIYQIREALEKTCRLVNDTHDVFAKAIIMMLLIAYIQPFADGNKRTSRLLANGVLLAGGAPPLSLRSIDEGEYKKAVILFYEQNNISYFKELFIQQLKFSVEN